MNNLAEQESAYCKHELQKVYVDINWLWENTKVGPISELGRIRARLRLALQGDIFQPGMSVIQEHVEFLEAENKSLKQRLIELQYPKEADRE